MTAPRSKSGLHGLWMAGLLLGPLPAAAQTRPEAIPAAWTQQKFQFAVLGFQTRYTCFALRDYVARVLLQLGARTEDFNVHEVDCTRNRPPSVAASFWQLRPLPPHGGRSSLRPVTAVPAHWQHVQLNFGRIEESPKLSACELAHQAMRAILPYFVYRNARFAPDCVEHVAGTAPFAVQLDVLMPGATPQQHAAPQA